MNIILPSQRHKLFIAAAMLKLNPLMLIMTSDMALLIPDTIPRRYNTEVLNGRAVYVRINHQNRLWLSIMAPQYTGRDYRMFPSGIAEICACEANPPDNDAHGWTNYSPHAHAAELIQMAINHFLIIAKDMHLQTI